MPRTAKAKSSSKDSTGTLGFEAKLWLAADTMRNNMDPAEYKHAVLGLIFLKYISDSFEAHHAEISNQNFRPIRVVLPQKEFMTAFTSQVAPIYERTLVALTELTESRTLATLRDTLLPKLLSGKIV